MTYETILEERGYHPPIMMLSIANKEGILQHMIMPEIGATKIDIEYQKPFDDMSDNEKAEYIIKLAKQYYGIIPNRSRKREQVTYRQVSMFLINKYTHMGLAQIGSYFYDRDHATVLHAFKTVKNLMETDRRYRENVENIINRIEL